MDEELERKLNTSAYVIIIIIEIIYILFFIHSINI